MEPLLTLVQISDLHFGDTQVNRGIVADDEAPDPFPGPSSPWSLLKGFFATFYAREYVTRLRGHDLNLLTPSRFLPAHSEHRKECQVDCDRGPDVVRQGETVRANIPISARQLAALGQPDWPE